MASPEKAKTERRKTSVVTGVLGTASGQVRLGRGTRVEGVMEMGQVQVRRTFALWLRAVEALKDFIE